MSRATVAAILCLGLGSLAGWGAFVVSLWEMDDMVSETLVLTDSIARLESALEFQITNAEGLDGEFISCWVRRAVE